MLDYSMNEFHRESFIVNYDIDPSEKEIMVNYADGRSDLVEYTPAEERKILEIMRDQIVNGQLYYKSLVKKKRRAKWKDRLLKLYGCLFISLFIAGLVLNTASAFLLLIASLPLNLLSIRALKKNKYALNHFIHMCEDYEKNLEFVNNSDSFSNEKILRPHVMFNAPDRVKFVISENVIANEFDSYKDVKQGIPAVDMLVFDDDEVIKDDITRKISKRALEEAVNDGYHEIKGDIPIINENSIDSLSYDDLYSLYKLTNSKQNTKGKVLVKIIGIDHKNR